MQNAHERFGVLELTRRVKDTFNEVRVQMDRLILEPSKDSRATILCVTHRLCSLSAEIGES